ncbi:hypothetical protein AB0I77_32650 [Streptomyces sp. NPDC050619]|uniref:hypothetical protein n=1 Tax=Streptomyces sp. NPDC050619 TaxID=3157214 RepID=UPI003424214D
MKNRTWIGAGAATTAVVMAATLWVDALQTGHTDGGLKDDPVAPVAPAASAPSECVGKQPVGSLPGPGPEDGTPDDTPLYRVLDHIDKLAAGRHAAVFTGLSVDEEDNAADVWRIPSAAFDTAVCGAAEKGVTVRLHDTDVNRGVLDALSDRITDDMNRWDGTFQVREVGVDERGFVSVGVDDPDRARPVLKKEFGERYLRVEHVEQAQPAHG